MGAKATAISNLFKNKLKQMEALPLPALMRSIELHERQIMNINKTQLDRGQDAKGKSLGKYKNFKYKNRWQPVDLLKEGDFRAKFTVGVDKKKTEIFSQDRKAPWLEKKYGKDIHGIQKSMLPTVGEIIKDDFLSEIKRNFK